MMIKWMSFQLCNIPFLCDIYFSTWWDCACECLCMYARWLLSLNWKWISLHPCNISLFSWQSVFQHLARLCTVVTECVSAFCVDFWLQTNLFESGVLWHLLPNLFQYDFTLDEGGVERSQESNQQVGFHSIYFSVWRVNKVEFKAFYTAEGNSWTEWWIKSEKMLMGSECRPTAVSTVVQILIWLSHPRAHASGS